MKQYFQITGIKCHNCIEKISSALKEKLSAITVDVIDNKQLILNAENKIDIGAINLILEKIGNYHVSEYVIDDNEEQTVSYKPIYIILAYLSLICILISIKNFSVNFAMSVFMSEFFLVFSFFKMLDIRGFAAGYSNYDLIAKKFYYYGYIYPFIELVFGIAYLLIPFSFGLNLLVLIVMFISTLGVINAKLSKRKFHCACVGTFLKVPLGNIALIEDVLMAAMSLLMILSV